MNLKRIVRKFKVVLLILMVLIRSVFKGKASKEVLKPKKILVVNLTKLGDMVCTTPMFRAVKEKYPESKVYVAGDKINKYVLENNNDVDGYYTFDYKMFKFLKYVNKQNFDFACIIHPYFISLVMLYLSNISLIAAPKIIGGFATQNTKAYRLLLKLVVTRDHHVSRCAPREFLRLLEVIGIDADNVKKKLGFSKQGEEKVLNLLNDNSIDLQTDLVVGISPGVGNMVKLWPAERFAKVADHVYKKYQAKIIIFGGGSDKDQVETMLKNLDQSTRVINLANQLNIDELKATISKVSLFISVDTGPIHIADAFNVPTIDILGPVDENTQSPIGKFNRIVKAKRDKPVIYTLNCRVYDPKEAKRQVDDITVNMVNAEVDSLIKDIIK